MAGWLVPFLLRVFGQRCGSIHFDKSQTHNTQKHIVHAERVHLIYEVQFLGGHVIIDLLGVKGLLNYCLQFAINFHSEVEVAAGVH